MPDAAPGRDALRRWWRETLVGSVDHQRVIAKVIDDSIWSPRYAFMTMMSAGIAVLGLLLSSPAVIIGAMLISPLMGPILGLGFSLALFDWAEMRRSLIALTVGAGAAVLFTAMIVAASPLQGTTAEILARTRPNLFDLLVAIFSALAGSYAIIRGRGETIVGVAIATALMPPLAVVGYGLATWNPPVLAGSAALFVTNLVAIALSATVMARLYGFGHSLSRRQTWLQTAMLLLVLGAMTVPLGLSLGRIAREAVVTQQVRAFLSARFGEDARVTQLDIDFAAKPMLIRSVVIAPRDKAAPAAALGRALQERLGQPVTLNLDQLLLDPAASSLEQERAALAQAGRADTARSSDGTRMAELVAVAAGTPASAVTLDVARRRATAMAAPLPGAGLASYKALEDRLNGTADGWTVQLVPPLQPLPLIEFGPGSEALGDEQADEVDLAAWAARRWNASAIIVPGGDAGTTPDARTLRQRRAAAVANRLQAAGIRALPGPAYGASLVLRFR